MVIILRCSIETYIHVNLATLAIINRVTYTTNQLDLRANSQEKKP